MLEWKIKKSETELNRWMVGGDLSNIRITRESRSAHLEEDIKKLKAFLNEKELAKEALLIMISHFKGLDNTILRMKYIERKTLKEIAKDLNYSYQHIVNKHSALVRMIKFIEHIN